MTMIKYKKSKTEQSRSYSEFAFEHYNKSSSCLSPRTPYILAPRLIRILELLFNKVSRKHKRTLKKEQDPGKFLILCSIHSHHLPNALCDTGSAVSIMAIDTAELLGLKMEPSKDSFTFVDSSRVKSAGMIKNVKVEIGECIIPVDFHAMDIKSGKTSPLLIGRAFMATVGAGSEPFIKVKGKDPRKMSLHENRRWLRSIDRQSITSINRSPLNGVDRQSFKSIDRHLTVLVDTHIKFRAAQTCQMSSYGWRPSHPEVMPVLLKSGQSASQEEAVEEMKECRSITQHWFGEKINSPSEIDWNNLTNQGL
ncbi:hypothetical protein DY000_02052440 [Brassica cretica]|uniref:Aspartic peptidase DDI1-type domain-containing protein n=1 Tax=Brassica cretica TaxID=69181 RepID=A0ABQ7A5D0_BRACR|nr:hypothetical protein DY000_02052440 [Brassica cretica]